MQDELSIIRMWKKIASQPGNQKKAAQAEEKEDRNKDPAMGDQPRQQLMVCASYAFESSFESFLKTREGVPTILVILVYPEHIHYQRGNKRAGKQIRSQHGENHGLGERNKQVARHTAQQEQRHKHDADAEGRHQSWNGDLLRSVEDGLFHIGLVALFENAIYVLDLNSRIVDENADRKCQTAQGHDVDRLAQKTQNDHRSENRQRNGDRNNDRAAPTPDEEKYHRRSQEPGNQGLADDAMDRAAHEN